MKLRTEAKSTSTEVFTRVLSQWGFRNYHPHDSNEPERKVISKRRKGKRAKGKAEGKHEGRRDNLPRADQERMVQVASKRTQGKDRKALGVREQEEGLEHSQRT